MEVNRSSEFVELLMIWKFVWLIFSGKWHHQKLHPFDGQFKIEFFLSLSHLIEKILQEMEGKKVIAQQFSPRLELIEFFFDDAKNVELYRCGIKVNT